MKSDPAVEFYLDRLKQRHSISSREVLVNSIKRHESLIENPNNTDYANCYRAGIKYFNSLIDKIDESEVNKESNKTSNGNLTKKDCKNTYEQNEETNNEQSDPAVEFYLDRLKQRHGISSREVLVNTIKIHESLIENPNNTDYENCYRAGIKYLNSLIDKIDESRVNKESNKTSNGNLTKKDCKNTYEQNEETNNEQSDPAVEFYLDRLKQRHSISSREVLVNSIKRHEMLIENPNNTDYANCYRAGIKYFNSLIDKIDESEVNKESNKTSNGNLTKKDCKNTYEQNEETNNEQSNSDDVDKKYINLRKMLEKCKLYE
jgi:hypothetical protein